MKSPGKPLKAMAKQNFFMVIDDMDASVWGGHKVSRRLIPPRNHFQKTEDPLC